MFRTTTESQSLNLNLTGYEVRPRVDVSRSGGVGHGGLHIGHTTAMLKLPLSALSARVGVPIADTGALGTVTVQLSIPALLALRDACDGALHGDGGKTVTTPDVPGTQPAIAPPSACPLHDEPTERDVEALAQVILPALPNHCCAPGELEYCPYDAHDAGGVARAILAADWYAECIAQARREGAAEALESWIAEWPTTAGDGTFLADIARAGLDRAAALRGAVR